MPGVTDSAFEAGIERGRVFAAATNTARDLTSRPADETDPLHPGGTGLEIADRYGIEAEILDEQKLNELGMDALLAVSRASTEMPRMIVLHYRSPGIQGDSWLGGQRSHF